MFYILLSNKGAVYILMYVTQTKGKCLCNARLRRVKNWVQLFCTRCLNYLGGDAIALQTGSQLYLCKQCVTLECNYTPVPRDRLRLALVLTTTLSLVLTFFD